MNYLYPQAIEYGMSADEFWKDDPQLFVSYRTSFINRKKRETEELDYKCWLQGLYFYDGNENLFSSLKQMLHNIFASLSKGQKDTSEIPKYPKKPYSELEKEKEQEKSKEKTIEQKHNESLIVQGSLKQIYLNRLKNKGRRD